jgi:hypothetical protein
MKKTLIILFLATLSSCYIARPGYIDYRQRQMLNWDPVYYTPRYFSPLLYQYTRPVTPTIIYRDRYVPVPSRPQQPRVQNNKPYTPPVPQSGNAPIRTFPKKDDQKDK